MTRLALAGLIALLGASTATAQYHSKSKAGETRVKASVVSPADQGTARRSAARAGQARSSQQVAAAARGRNARVGANANSTLYMSEAQREAFGAKLGRQKAKPISAWSRAIHHSDGTYTESKRDEETNTLEQVTKSENGTELQRRNILLDRSGRPSEVLIYDARDEFQYRGVLVYDELGRFEEEQLYDANDELIRRKIQEYDPNGKKLPVRTVDYVEEVPEDLKLVITRKDEAERRDREGSDDESDSGGLFGNGGKDERRRNDRAEADDGKKKQGLRLGRLFGGGGDD